MINYYPAPPPIVIYPAFPTDSCDDLASPSSDTVDTEDPRLRATFGPLHITNSALPKEYLVGRDSGCDLVLGGKFCNVTSKSLSAVMR